MLDIPASPKKKVILFHIVVNIMFDVFNCMQVIIHWNVIGW